MVFPCWRKVIVTIQLNVLADLVYNHVTYNFFFSHLFFPGFLLPTYTLPTTYNLYHDATQTSCSQ